MSDGFSTEFDKKIEVKIEHNRHFFDTCGYDYQDYNFLDYYFSTKSGVIRARAYLDDIKKIQFICIRTSENIYESINAENIPMDILEYAKRRFEIVL
jgi:hypothetical protein